MSSWCYPSSRPSTPNHAKLLAAKRIATIIEFTTVACTSAFLLSLTIPATRTDLGYYHVQLPEEINMENAGIRTNNLGSTRR